MKKMSISQAVEKLNKMHAAILHKGKTLVATEVPIENSLQKEISFSRIQNIAGYYRAWNVVDGAGNPVDIVREWEKHPERRTNTCPRFRPPHINDPALARVGATVPYELFQGWAMKPSPAGDWSLFQEHAERIIFGDDPEIIRYGWDYIADIYQNPGATPPGVAIAVISGKGYGKTTFGHYITKPLGVHGHQIAGTGALFGRFNASQAGKLLTIGEEILCTNNKEAEARLKTAVTDPFIQIEQKNIDPITVENHNRFFFFSNERSVVPATIGERRFLVLEARPDRARDYSYFQAIRNQMDNGGTAAMLHWLLNRKITSNLHDAPVTRALWSQIAENFSPELAFLHEILTSGKTIKDTPRDIPKSHLYAEYCKFLHATKRRGSISESQFSRAVKTALPGLSEARITVNGARQRIWRFPALTAAREMFLRGADWRGPDPWADSCGQRGQ
jgi:hypothetical protein